MVMSSPKCNGSPRSTSRDKANRDVWRHLQLLSVCDYERDVRGKACGQLRRRARDDKIRAFEFYLAALYSS